MEKLIENIKTIRIEKGISQEAMGLALNIDGSNWSRIENGITKLST